MEKRITLKEGSSIRTLRDIIPEARKENAEREALAIPTNSFFLERVYPGELYTVIGTTNSGKTWWSLGTGISLVREGRTVGYITTEDTTNDIVSYLDEFDEDDEVFDGICMRYLEDVSAQGLRLLIKELYNAGCDVIMIDYLRTDILSSHSGDINLTMGTLFKTLRGALQEFPVSIIQTIQANASLYNEGVLKTYEKKESAILTMVDGGYTASKRSHGLGVLIEHNGEKGILALKTKDRRGGGGLAGTVFFYGEVKYTNFDIKYKKGVYANSLGPQKTNSGSKVNVVKNEPSKLVEKFNKIF